MKAAVARGLFTSQRRIKELYTLREGCEAVVKAGPLLKRSTSGTWEAREGSVEKMAHVPIAI